MEITLPHRSLPKAQVNFLDLSNELVTIIFEHLLPWDLGLDADDAHFESNQDQYLWKALPNLRLVCKLFNLLATPIRFREWTIQELVPGRIRRPQPRKVRKAVAENVKQYTEHLTVIDKINWNIVVNHHASLPRLKIITWKIHGNDATWLLKNLYPIPKSILRPNVKVEVHGTGHYHDFMSLIPPEHVSALFLGNWFPHRSDGTSVNAYIAQIMEYNSRFKQYILQASRLQCLDYDLAHDSVSPGGSAPQFATFQPQEKMPALRKLALTAYDWHHTMEEVKQSWDFSRLKYLDITGMNHNAFIRSVDVKWFSSLRSLKLGTFLWLSPSTEIRQSRQTLLHTFLRNVPHLQHLNMNAYTRDFPSDILMAMENLRSLKFTEEIISLGEQGVSPRLGMQDLEELLQYLPRLERLYIDLETWQGDFKRTLIDLISQFPALRHVDINNHGTNTDLSDTMYSMVRLDTDPGAKLICLHDGMYVDEGVSPFDGTLNMQWGNRKTIRWVIPGSLSLGPDPVSTMTLLRACWKHTANCTRPRFGNDS